MKLSPTGLRWVGGFFLSFAFFLSLSRPEKIGWSVALFPVGFCALFPVLWLAPFLRGWRARRRLRRVWSRIEAEALRPTAPGDPARYPDRQPQPDRRY